MKAACLSLLLGGLAAGGVSAQTWRVTVSANVEGFNGQIEPAGTFQVPNGGEVVFQLIPAEYCYLQALKVNGLAVAAQTNQYALTVRTNLEVEAIFWPILTRNGTPHFWLARHGLTADGYEAESQKDSDNDGFKNWEEWLAGTNPTNPASHRPMWRWAIPKRDNWSWSGRRAPTAPMAFG